ncbi:hypothetical protein V2J09_014111 [Rumex salicifolius]
MPRVAAVASSLLKRSRKGFKDVDLLKALQNEISHEQSSSSDQFQYSKLGSIGDFKLTWDTPYSQDIVLQKKCLSDEEVAVSALLGPESKNSSFPWDVNMKVCMKKPGLSSILQFDCKISSNDSGVSEFYITRANYLPSLAPPTRSDYKGPSFSTLDPSLQEELKKYLEARGIGESLTNFLLLQLHKKEQKQYFTWLEKLRDMIEGYYNQKIFYRSMQVHCPALGGVFKLGRPR